MPFENVGVLLDNYLTNQCCQIRGHQMITEDEPLPTEECECKDTRYPACVMIRAMARKQHRTGPERCFV